MNKKYMLIGLGVLSLGILYLCTRTKHRTLEQKTIKHMPPKHYPY